MSLALAKPEARKRTITRSHGWCGLLIVDPENAPRHRGCTIKHFCLIAWCVWTMSFGIGHPAPRLVQTIVSYDVN